MSNRSTSDILNDLSIGVGTRIHQLRYQGMPLDKAIDAVGQVADYMDADKLKAAYQKHLTRTLANGVEDPHEEAFMRSELGEKDDQRSVKEGSSIDSYYEQAMDKKYTMWRDESKKHGITSREWKDARANDIDPMHYINMREYGANHDQSKEALQHSDSYTYKDLLDAGASHDDILDLYRTGEDIYKFKSAVRCGATGSELIDAKNRLSPDEFSGYLNYRGWDRFVSDERLQKLRNDPRQFQAMSDRVSHEKTMSFIKPEYNPWDDMLKEGAAKKRKSSTLARSISFNMRHGATHYLTAQRCDDQDCLHWEKEHNEKTGRCKDPKCDCLSFKKPNTLTEGGLWLNDINSGVPLVSAHLQEVGKLKDAPLDHLMKSIGCPYYAQSKTATHQTVVGSSIPPIDPKKNGVGPINDPNNLLAGRWAEHHCEINGKHHCFISFHFPPISGPLGLVRKSHTETERDAVVRQAFRRKEYLISKGVEVIDAGDGNFTSGIDDVGPAYKEASHKHRGEFGRSSDLYDTHTVGTGQEDLGHEITSGNAGATWFSASKMSPRNKYRGAESEVLPESRIRNRGDRIDYVFATPGIAKQAAAYKNNSILSTDHNQQEVLWDIPNHGSSGVSGLEIKPGKDIESVLPENHGYTLRDQKSSSKESSKKVAIFDDLKKNIQKRKRKQRDQESLQALQEGNTDASYMAVENNALKQGITANELDDAKRHGLNAYSYVAMRKKDKLFVNVDHYQAKTALLAGMAPTQYKTLRGAGLDHNEALEMHGKGYDAFAFDRALENGMTQDEFRNAESRIPKERMNAYIYDRSNGNNHETTLMRDNKNWNPWNEFFSSKKIALKEQFENLSDEERQEAVDELSYDHREYKSWAEGINKGIPHKEILDAHYKGFPVVKYMQYRTPETVGISKNHGLGHDKALEVMSHGIEPSLYYWATGRGVKHQDMIEATDGRPLNERDDIITCLTLGAKPDNIKEWYQVTPHTPLTYCRLLESGAKHDEAIEASDYAIDDDGWRQKSKLDNYINDRNSGLTHERAMVKMDPKYNPYDWFGFEK